MRRIFLALISILYIFGMVPTAFASDNIASGPVTLDVGYYFCVALEDPTPAMAKGRAIYTGVFQAHGNGTPLVRDAFVKFVQEKYQYSQDPTTINNSFLCTSTHSMEEATMILGYRVAPGKKQNPQGTIESGWTFPLESSDDGTARKAAMVSRH